MGGCAGVTDAPTWPPDAKSKSFGTSFPLLHAQLARDRDIAYLLLRLCSRIQVATQKTSPLQGKI